MGRQPTMQQWQRKAAGTIPSAHPARSASLLLAALLVAVAGAAAAESPQVYRCTAADGSIEYRQYPCHERDSATRIDIDDARSGWVPPKPTARDARKADKRPTKPAMVKTDPARDDRCWKKQRQLDEVNRRLRAGYTPVQGERLRQRRRDHEAYLRRFCKP